MAPIIQELKKIPVINSRVAVTAQHRHLLDQVLSLFEIKPNMDLDIMLPDQTLFEITTRSLLGLNTMLEKEKPDLVLVQGDTTTTFASALSAFYHKIPVGHVEAGLRTMNQYDPFPEEMNRRMTTVLADLHFASTPLARKHLLSCGIPKTRIFVTGNTVIDALKGILKQSKASIHPVLQSISPGSRILLVEAHRRENFGEPMENICDALFRIVQGHPDTCLIFSVHKNPHVQTPVYSKLKGKERIFLVEPVDYPTLVNLEQRAHLILTDSGGIQEEAPTLGKPVLVLRRTTERPEGVQAGVAKLVGADADRIYWEATKLLNDKKEYARMSRKANPYGDGKAARRIVDAILYFFGKKKRPREWR